MSRNTGVYAPDVYVKKSRKNFSRLPYEAKFPTYKPGKAILRFSTSFLAIWEDCRIPFPGAFVCRDSGKMQPCGRGFEVFNANFYRNQRTSLRFYAQNLCRDEVKHVLLIWYPFLGERARPHVFLSSMPIYFPQKKVMRINGMGCAVQADLLSSGICFAEKYRPHHALHSPFSH